VDKESKSKQERLLASLSQEQWMLWMESENAKRAEQISELYDITRGILSWPRLLKFGTSIMAIISIMFAIGKLIDTGNSFIVSKHEEKRLIESLPHSTDPPLN
jgi:hypothetical protein